MYSSVKGKEHKSCGCFMCRRGAGSSWGQSEHRQVNRSVRHQYRQALAEVVKGADPESVDRVIGETDYTD